MDEAQAQAVALDILERLVRHGAWYMTAIELGLTELDGEKLEAEALAALHALGRCADIEPIKLK